MIKTKLLPAAVVVAGFAALAGCSSGANHPMTQTSSAAPMATAPAAPAAMPEVSPGLIRRVQTSLRQQGFYKGHIDGVWGPQTQGAIHGYQQAHNLTVNGQLDSQTLASLDTASTGNEQPVPTAMAPAAPMAAAAATPPASTAPAAAQTTAPTPAPAMTTNGAPAASSAQK